MKKTLLFLGLFILTLTATLTSCNNSENNDGNDISDNHITIGDHFYRINSAFIVADDIDKETELSFYCDDLLFTIDLEGHGKLPTGTFEITREGRYTAEADMFFHNYDYEISGALTISESSDIIVITISGNAYKDRASKKFSLSFKGNLENNGDNGGSGEIPSGNNISINETLYPIESALYYVENDFDGPEVNISFINKNGAVVEISLDNLNDLTVGNYPLTAEGLYQADVTTIMYDLEIIGELVISKDKDVYKVTILGNAVDEGIILPFAMNYEGEIVNTSIAR